MKRWLAAAGIFLGSLIAAGPASAADDDTGTPDAEELSYQEKKDLLTETALEYDIPPEVLKAIAYEETKMRQFTENGEPIMNENEDGGIGMMQVTLNENDLQNRNINRERLGTDTAYNIQIGAELLNEKWEWTGKLIPQVNNGERHILENWYFAILAYNGLDRRNDPNFNDDTYQDGLYRTMMSRNLLETADLPEFKAEYRDGESRMRFADDQMKATTETKTPSTQMFQEGTDVYSYAEEPGSIINFRLEPSISSRKVGDVPLYMPLTVEGNLEHDNSRENHFGYYPFYYADIHGYMASSYVREGEVTPFYDVRRQEVTEAVGFLEVRDIISGYPDGTFRPNDPILRRHAAAMLSKALNLSVPDDYTMKAVDMDKGDLGYQSMKTMEYHKLMTGSNGNIRPNEYMSRAQMASVLTAAFKDVIPNPSVRHDFDDISTDFWNYDAINALYQSGLTNQDPYRPSESVKRSQFALFLKRAMTIE